MTSSAQPAEDTSGKCKCGHGPECHVNGGGQCGQCGACFQYWRQSWKSTPTRARAEPLPSGDEIRDEMMRHLRAIVIDADASTVARVQAAKAILEETAPDIREHIVKLMKGDKAKYREWLKAELAAMEAGQ